MPEICRKHGISAWTFYGWRKRYGGESISDVKRMRELEAENAKLKRLDDMIFGMSQVPVSTTVVAGKVLMRNRELVGIDEERIAARARETSAKLWSRL